MKKLLYLSFALVASVGFAQDDDDKKKDWGTLTGGFESNIQWYNDDTKLGKFAEEEHFRSNNYLKLDYNYGNWFAGIQVESYAPMPLLNYSPKLDDTGIALYYAKYKTRKLEVTAGYFYEQFGSGLILRGWENRPLGINNAFRGGRIKYQPSNALEFTALYARQRDGFKVSEGDIFGFNSEIDLTNALKLETSTLSAGISYVGRKQDIPEDFQNMGFDELTNSFSARLDFSGSTFYSGIEYITKGKDIIVNSQRYIENFVEKGNALLVNFGYSQKGLGIDATFRRLENMNFFSEREASGNVFNENILNYLPGLTKQHDYALTNIYVYQAQPAISVPDPSLLKFGEIGGQIDIFYNFEKGTSLGGKYGTKVAFNASYWAGLKGDFNFTDRDAEIEYFGFGQKYFSEFSMEVRKKWSPKWRSIFYYVNQYYNQRFIIDERGVVNSNIAVAEATYKINSKKSIRAELQHLWTPDDDKNWAGGTLEFNVTPRLSFYATDIYNYGNDNTDEQIHYYNFGGSFTKGATRIALNYGRQRGGLVCVGGVCRFVPQSTGLTINLSTAF
ncbi:DUF6029 family protein [Kordia zhangzhouensis]|uniref:DUF6029 family protein n=1 Tax=Kordia zhangzhouensis TaxID=1620405 RepID=UPI000628FFDF|nr:DUF6029 family protein [Kordia zhangzhouensis]